MSNQKTKSEIEKHKQYALKTLESLLNKYIASDNPSVQIKADKLSYWLEDYSKFISCEDSFSPLKLKRYERGDVIKVHLGYNIGSEEGGLHYCVVLDKENALSSPILTVIPLTSVKPSTNIEKLPKGSVYLGNALYTAMYAKISSMQTSLKSQIEGTMQRITELQEKLKSSGEENEALEKEIEECIEQAKVITSEYSVMEKASKEILKMKKGSIALVSQITTISKIRIYDPKTKHDVLAKIKLSNENLDEIDKTIQNLYTK